MLKELMGEVIEIVEGCAFDDVVVQGAPKAFDLAVGLWPVGSCVAVPDAEFQKRGLEGVLFKAIAGGELGAVEV